MVLQTLDAIQAMGFTVVRIWAFNDGPGWMSLQPAPGDHKGAVPYKLQCSVHCPSNPLVLLGVVATCQSDAAGLTVDTAC